MSTPTKNINAEKIQGNLAINSITASTISATTYQNLPLDIRVTGATYNNNTFTYTNNTGGTFSVLFNSVTGLTVNGGLSATTLYGDGSNITGINFSQLATTAHTHSISDVINLQTNLDSKIDKPASPFLGDYLYYNGITWVPNQVNIPVAAGAGVTLFLSITGSSLPTYEYLSQFPIELTESQEPVTVNNSQALIGKYATEQLNRTVVDPGIWEFNTYASVDIPSTGLTQIIVTAYLLTTGNTETFLFSASTENITTTAATLYTISVVEPQYSCSTSDYLVVNYSASTTNNFNTVVTLYHGGDINYSHIHTPFVTLHNDLAGLQGGFSNEYYHLSKNEVDLLTTSVDASSIHNHDSLYLGLGGGTITGNTEVAGSFSASTYLGLPIDVFVTGATYNNANQFSFTNNTGGTFNVSFNQVTGLTATTISATTISGGTLYGDGTNLTGTNTIVSNTVFVSKLGNDSTGSRTNMGKPFLTLEAALTAATSGDLIVVFPGSYTATTTSVNGLAKDGISWYFNPGVTVTKTNSGDMFNTSGFTNGFNVYGQADFVRTTTTGYILNGGSSATFRTPFNIIFECRNITQSTAGGTFAFRLWDGTNNYTGTFRLNNVTNTGSNIFNLDDRGVIDITANYLRCTAGNVFYQYNGNMQVNIKANIIQSTSTYAIRGNYYSYMNVSCNQLLGIGNTYYAIFIDDRYDVTLNFDYCSGIQHNGLNCIANGHINRLLVTSTSSNFKGGVCDNINISPTTLAGNIGGTVETTYNGDGLGTLTMSNGNAIITMSNSTYGGFRGLNITGGVLRLIGNSIGISTYSSNLINGGTVYFDGYCKYANTEYVGYGNGELFTLQNGKLIISGRMEQSLTGRTTNVVPTCVLWSGGTLVVNGGTLITKNVENPPIIAISSGTTNLQVLSGGLNTNFTGGTLTAKKYKAKYTVTAVFSTSIALNDGSGATETFTETNTAVYNTRALLAQRMAALINASATLDITATQDTPGTDVYFYIESDFAGVPVTRTTLTNLTELILRLNAYAMTNSTGGIIIENSIIT